VLIPYAAMITVPGYPPPGRIDLSGGGLEQRACEKVIACVTDTAGGVYAVQCGGTMVNAPRPDGVSADLLHGCGRFHPHHLISLSGPWRIEYPPHVRDLRSLP
jgi:hypothetical protein